MRYFVAILLLALAPAVAVPCSCSGTATIDETIRARPLLVEAQVIALEEVDSKQYGHQVLSVTLKVLKVLKGSMSAKTIVVEHLMCYASLFPKLMKIGHTYVLPLLAPEEGKYQLAGCAHSGLELVDGKLFTFEQTEGVGRRLQFYANYVDFVRRLQTNGMAPNTSLERTRGR